MRHEVQPGAIRAIGCVFVAFGALSAVVILVCVLALRVVHRRAVDAPSLRTSATVRVVAR